MIGTLPSCHAPSKKVQVSENFGSEILGCEELTVAAVSAIIATTPCAAGTGGNPRHYRRNC
ncbi:hypothetical protein [Bradyrhizobium sp. S69]|uniref:hypothetical protein n=1 Tax=Bradyrhizobium sp. S69 TaxID=1641856 RepID=UPI001FEF4671|nr:hypothetical protein [Bradyrhizobium sp. S69]